MRVFGIEINFGGSTTLDEIEQADQEYNELRDNGNSDEADELAREMCNKGFIPHYDRESRSFWFVDKQ